MSLYRIRNWNKHFENNRTRELVDMKWVPVPNKHDGDGFTELMDRPDGTEIYGAWVLILQVASKSGNPAGGCGKVPTWVRESADVGAGGVWERGTLMRDGNKPHDSASLARQTHGRKEVFDKAIPVLVSIGWLEELQYPAGGCGKVPTWVRDNDYGREGKGKEVTTTAPVPDAEVVSFSKTESNAQMQKVEVTVVEEPKQNGWSVWIDVNRKAKRKDPVTLGPDTAAAARLWKAFKADVSALTAIYKAYLDDKAPFVVNKGYSLQYLSPNKYLNGDVATFGRDSPVLDFASPNFDPFKALGIKAKTFEEAEKDRQDWEAKFGKAE